MTGWRATPVSPDGAVELKHEGLNPTASFKDRGMTVGVSHARAVGARIVACASTGNTSASLAAYAAAAGIPSLVLVPATNVAMGKLAQTIAYGATVVQVDGDFDQALALLRELTAAYDVYLVNSVNPFRLEGQKTIVFEMLEQRGWQAPDWIVLPGGNLGNTSAFGKALVELHAVGLIDRMPRLAVIQAAGAAPFAAYLQTGFEEFAPVQAETVATAIKIGNPASTPRARRSIEMTHGWVTTVDGRRDPGGQSRHRPQPASAASRRPPPHWPDYATSSARTASCAQTTPRSVSSPGTSSRTRRRLLPTTSTIGTARRARAPTVPSASRPSFPRWSALLADALHG